MKEIQDRIMDNTLIGDVDANRDNIQKWWKQYLAVNNSQLTSSEAEVHHRESDRGATRCGKRANDAADALHPFEGEQGSDIPRCEEFP